MPLYSWITDSIIIWCISSSLKTQLWLNIIYFHSNNKYWRIFLFLNSRQKYAKFRFTSCEWQIIREVFNIKESCPELHCWQVGKQNVAHHNVKSFCRRKGFKNQIYLGRLFIIHVPGSPLNSLCWAPPLWLDPRRWVGYKAWDVLLLLLNFHWRLSSPVVKTAWSRREAVINKWFPLTSTICNYWCPPVPFIKHTWTYGFDSISYNFLIKKLNQI